jgi:hypothetical protein
MLFIMINYKLLAIDNRIELLKSRQNSANGPIIKKLKEAKYGQ